MIKSNMLASVAFIALRAFDPGKAGWKLSADGKTIEMKDGNPIWVDANGNEGTLDQNAITARNEESRRHRERAEKAEADLKKFEKITDPEKALQALDTLSKIDQKKLIDAGEVDRVRDTIKAEFTGQIDETKKRADALEAENNEMRIKAAFAGSKFMQERVAVPHEMFEAQFAKNFKVEEKKVIPYGLDGNRVMSKKNIGQYADVDEAFEIILDGYAHKDQILKAPNHSGSGNNGGGGNRGTGRYVKRSDFQKLSPYEQADTAKKMQMGELQIVEG